MMLLYIKYDTTLQSNIIVYKVAIKTKFSYRRCPTVCIPYYPCATVDLRLKGHGLSTDIVVVSPLTAEAIAIGPGLPEEHQAHIDLPNQQIHLASQGISLPLQAPSPPRAVTSRIAVRVLRNLRYNLGVKLS